MVTCKDDVALTIERVGKITEDWLKKHNVQYDHLIFGKPYSSTLYVDDKACINDPKEIRRRLEAIENGTYEEYVTAFSRNVNMMEVAAGIMSTGD
jgi:hypothetical protein